MLDQTSTAHTHVYTTLHARKVTTDGRAVVPHSQSLDIFLYMYPISFLYRCASHVENKQAVWQATC